MSHFVTLVFTKENGRTVEELLAPYDENIVYAPYVQYTREQAIAKIRKEIEDYKNGTLTYYGEDKAVIRVHKNGVAYENTYIREEFDYND